MFEDLIKKELKITPDVKIWGQKQLKKIKMNLL